MRWEFSETNNEAPGDLPPVSVVSLRKEMVIVKGFIEEYVESIHACLAGIPPEVIQKLAGTLLSACERGATIFIAGNGGSAATASHLACDLTKTTLGTNPRDKSNRFRAVSLSDNVALMTAWANDEGYEHIFSEQIKNLGRVDDVLVVTSASGNSPKKEINAR